MATAPNTTVRIYDDSANPVISLSTAGVASLYDFPNNACAVYVEASALVSICHRSGTGEEGAVLIPSLYAIGQNRMIYYRIGEGVTDRKGFAVFRSGTETGFYHFVWAGKQCRMERGRSPSDSRCSRPAGRPF